MINTERLVNTFLELVKINSPSFQEGKLAAYLFGKLQILGFDVYFDETGSKIGGEIGNLIGIKKGNRKGEPLLFSAHMDTVQPTIGIKTIIQNGIIKTDGTTILGADDKAGIATFLEAIQCLVEKNIPHPDLEVIFSVAEEIGLLGAKNLNYDKLKSKLAFVLDSGGPVGIIVIQTPTQMDLDIEVIGKTAHAGVNPEDGINAIYIASKALAQLSIGRIDEETTNNLGVIKGGKGTNIVPDEVEIHCELRSMNINKLEQQLELIKAAFEKTVNQLGGNYCLTTETGFVGFNLSKENPAVLMASKALENCGLTPVFIARGGGSDANVFNLNGLDAVNLGVGISCDHTNEEHISIDNLIKCTAMILRLITG